MDEKLNPSQFMRQHSAAEVEGMPDEQVKAVRDAGAVYQRGMPERTMVRAQEAIGGGLYSHSMEHIGDLTHRMNELAGRFGTEYVSPKIRSQHASLHHEYGYEREVGEQFASNKRYRDSEGKPALNTDEIRAVGQRYADEHRKVPVYNYPSEVARDAAVALGEHRFDDVRSHLSELHAMDEGGKAGRMTYAKGDLGGLLKHDKQGMVDYLRDKESRTPAITRAATTMLGGRQK